MVDQRPIDDAATPEPPGQMAPEVRDWVIGRVHVLRAEGLTIRQIVDRLGADHRVQRSETSVSRYLKMPCDGCPHLGSTERAR